MNPNLLTVAVATALCASLPAQLATFTTSGTGCPVATPPGLSVNQPPLLGQTTTVTCGGLPLDTIISILFVGNTQINVPLDGLLGVPGCTGYVAGTFASPTMLTTPPTASLDVLIPNDPLLVGMLLETQMLGLSTGSGWLASDRGTMTVGSWSVLPNMVPIAAGTFQMGSSAPVGQAPYFNQAQSQPVHAVTITQPFWMGKYEVTQSEYQAVMGSNPSFFQGVNLPVESVSWFNAVSYCDALSVQEAAAGRLPSGYEYRLPTEAEWEYCCRAGTNTEYHYGATLLCGQANFFYSYHTGSVCGGAMTMVVGSYAANAWGLHDMHGNVWEWCLDSWDVSANYPAGSVSDPYVTSGPGRVIRGGSWGSDSNGCRSAYRDVSVPAGAGGGCGFRVVCAPVL